MEIGPGRKRGKPEASFNVNGGFKKFKQGPGPKRGKPEASFNGNSGFKKFKQEMESFPTDSGRKLKPCTKFFSTTGCPFGEGCHFLHYVPGGIKPVTQIIGSNPALPSAARNLAPSPPFPEGPSPPTVKTRVCNKYNTAEGCRFGDKCRFAHSELELGKPMIPSCKAPRGMMVGQPMGGGGQGSQTEPPPVGNFGASATHSEWGLGKPMIPSYKGPRGMMVGPPMGGGGQGSRTEPPPVGSFGASTTHSEWGLGKPMIPSYKGPRGMMVGPPMGGGGQGSRTEPPPVGSSGATATAKISIDASISGAIIGKGGGNSKQISNVTGPKLSARDHKSDPNLKNIDLEGSSDQIKQAGTMDSDIIVKIGSSAPGPSIPMVKNPPGGPGSGFASGFKTKLCEKFAKGTCTLGSSCHNAHGSDELRTSGM